MKMWEEGISVETKCKICGKIETVFYPGYMYICLKCIKKWKGNPSFRWDLDL